MNHLYAIYEKFATELFHFCFDGDLTSILRTDFLRSNGSEWEYNKALLGYKRSPARDWYGNKLSDKKDAMTENYISFTRNPRAYEGFTSGRTDYLLCRIKFDPDKMRKFKIVPFQFTAFNNWDKVKNRDGRHYDGEDKPKGFWDQREERLLMADNGIKDLHKYIERIDVLIYEEGAITDDRLISINNANQSNHRLPIFVYEKEEEKYYNKMIKGTPIEQYVTTI